MDQPVISIIVASKNAERYLSQSLDSIAAQTYRAFEVVVVDGGSTDNSICIAEAYPNTTCIKQVGTGFTGAWNEGIDAARGSHIAFLDSDDIWVPYKLAIQMEYY